MFEIAVRTSGSGYPLLIGPAMLSEVRRVLPGGRRLLAISDSNVAPLYLDSLGKCLGEPVESIVIQAGESSKTIDTLQEIWDDLAARKFPRDGLLIALGGGVVGDITGFAAATWMRGIPFVQIPTTLLAQVDASVGGKTAVNLDAGKNLVGAFHQPDAVLIDTDLLLSLPDREFSSGAAEIVKSALLAGEEFLSWLEDNAERLNSRDDRVLAEAIRRSCELKAAIVSADETETGRRAVLNLGHTFGHAIETSLGHGTWLHGEAVAAGIVMALHLSEIIHGNPTSLRDRVIALLQVFSLPVSRPGNVPPDDLLKLMKGDKKTDSKGLRLITLAAPGDPQITRIADEAPLMVVLESK